MCGSYDAAKCHPITKKCDGHDDCGDGSDEMNCNCTCSNGFTCMSSCDCIDPKRVCDSYADCKDGSDEKNCSCAIGEYTCRGGICLNATRLCDGSIDCAFGDDETHPSCGKVYISVLFN